MKIEQGVMVMKDGKAWGVNYSDGKATSYGWIDPENNNARITDASCCKKPTDVTYKGSPYVKELSTAKIVQVVRITQVFVKDETT